MTTAVRTPQRLYPSDDPAAYARWVRRQRAYGRWQPFVDAAPVRSHLLHLMATTDAGWRRLATAAGVPHGTINHLLYGSHGQRAKRITPDNARRIFALQPDSTGGFTLPSAGAQRRIHVLIGEGWPQIHIGPQINTHPQYVNELLKTPRVTTTTATAVADAYTRLRGVDPLTCGVTPHGVGIALRLAARNQWPDRLFWDDCQDRIDDPDFDPATVLEDTPKYMRMGEDALWLRKQGFTMQQIADRFGETSGYIAKTIARYQEATAAEKQVAA